MKVTFVHDHKFRRINGRIYSPGGLSNEILMRYTQLFGEVTVIGRVLDEDETRSNYSEIINTKVTIKTNQYLEAAIRESDAVIIRLPSINGYRAVYMAKKYQKPYLTEVVGCTWDAYWNYGAKGKVAALPAFLIMRHCVRYSPFAMYVTKEFLQRRYPCKGHTAAISDVALQSEEPDVLQRRLEKIHSSQKGKLVIGTAAAVDVGYKGHEFVIRAIPQLEKELGIRVEYQLAGAGDAGRLKKIASEIETSDNLKFVGIVPHEKIFEWLDGLDLYIQPSLLEGLSRALIEAMSRGLPCFASACGGNPELLDETCLFSTRKRAEISGNILSVIGAAVRDDMLEQFAARNYNQAVSQYSRSYLDDLRNNFYESFKAYVSRNS